jgi:hypothetical protein
MNWLTTLKTLLSLFPMIIDAVNILESAFPQAGQGAAKLEVVKTTLKSAFDVATDGVGVFDKIWPSIQSIITSVVNLKNGIPKGT